MNIAVIGTGYVGLVTGTCFSETGNNVICVDIDEAKVNKLKSGKITIFEPGLELFFTRNIKQGRLHFTTNLQEAVEASDIIFLALPTPPREDGSADLSYILKVAEDMAPFIKKYKVIVDKSTVPVGTSDRVTEKLSEHVDVAMFDVVSNPEFLREGMAVEDFMKPDRVVIGTSSQQARQWMHELFEPFVRQGNPIIYMDERSAEMTKYAANSYLATRISFMNEIANLCEAVGANVDMVRIGMGSDGRIGKRFLFPGIGYGGSCFPKDVRALHKTADENGYDFKILNAVVQVNDRQKSIFIDKVMQYYDQNITGKRFAVWGLAFKPNTDDIREAPALWAIDFLLEKGAEISCFDPEAMENVKGLYGEKLNYVDDQYDALIGADALLIFTEWNEFRSPGFKAMKELLKSPVIFDGRNLYDLEKLEAEGFYYNSIGRETIK